MNRRVLIFDDEVDLLEICKIILGAKSFDVFTVTDCKNIFENIERFEPDIIIMDNLIPEIGGVKSTQLIKQNNSFKNIPVILFTVSNHIEALATEAGADGFIKKPFDAKNLVDTVEKFLPNCH